MLAEAISVPVVIAMMRAVSMFETPHFPEIATAISTASNHDPLFPHRKEGCAATAAVLVAIAWHESNFRPNAVGDNGESLGLYQIQPPTAKIDGKLLLIPRNASYVAIDLVRTSFRQCKDKPWEERLSWYISSGYGCHRSEKIRELSRVRMQTATKALAGAGPKLESGSTGAVRLLEE